MLPDVEPGFGSGNQGAATLAALPVRPVEEEQDPLDGGPEVGYIYFVRTGICFRMRDLRRRDEEVDERMGSGSKRHSLQAVELSQWSQIAGQIVSNLPVPSNGGSIKLWGGGGASRSCGPAGWLALLLTKAGDVETNPDPTTHKRVWICDICYKQIRVKKQVSIRCNRIEHLVHLRCAGISQAQDTDTSQIAFLRWPYVGSTLDTTMAHGRHTTLDQCSFDRWRMVG